MKRVLFLASYYPNKFGNEGIFIKKHADSLYNNKNVEINVFAIKDCILNPIIPFEIERNLNEHLIYYNTNTSGFKWVKSIKRLKNLILGLRYGIKNIQKPEIIHLNCVHPLGFVGVLLSIYWRIPLILTEHSSIYIDNEFYKYTNFFSRLHYYITFFFAKKITAVSEYHKNEIIKKIPLSKKKIFVIPNIVTENFEFYQKEKIKYNLLHVSNLKNVKGLENIFEAIKKLKNERKIFNLNIIGGKKEEIEFYSKLAESMDISDLIIFHGEKTVKELSKFYQNSDVLIMNSEFETFGVVFIESISTGTPVISNITGVLNDSMIKPFVIPFEHGSAENIKNAIIKFYDNPIILTRNNAEKIKKEFSELNVSDKFVKLYDY